MHLLFKNRKKKRGENQHWIGKRNEKTLETDQHVVTEILLISQKNTENNVLKILKFGQN